MQETKECGHILQKCRSCLKLIGGKRLSCFYLKNVEKQGSSLYISLSLSYPQHSLPDVLPLLGSSALGFQLLHPHPTQAPFELVGKPALPRIRICKLTQDTQVSCNWTWLSNVSSSNLSRVQAFLLFGFLSALNIKKKLEFATCSSCSTLRVVAEFLAGKWVLVHN